MQLNESLAALLKKRLDALENKIVKPRIVEPKEALFKLIKNGEPIAFGLLKKEAIVLWARCARISEERGREDKFDLQEES